MSSSYLRPLAIEMGDDQLVISFNQTSPSGLEGWEENDPCRYANQSCKGKMFGKLKSCRRQREKSQALCKAHDRKLAETKKMEQEKQLLLTALQHNVTDTAAKQQTASTAMIAGAAIGGVAILGALVSRVAKKKKAKSKTA
ncbi:hypothetical protein NC796_02500 [Aliifodinibius sp. S!AR15-10]|uniref:hypothetical protein n=1 Tax=Aliifodinibius sp. S!AR15-10 TaxID=2950437 RepID=UPI00285C74CE|nr:hypothetical protein [Aliifodinibius sp. S!AR15-10]MDR8389992.1 hypothetical protein [Aliifodinibius sp. S!AR15-10]